MTENVPEYFIKRETLTAIGDEVRDLSGITSEMGLGTMTTNLKEANEDVRTEAELITQIRTALENKAAGSGEIVEPNLQSKAVTPATSQQVVTADDGYDGLNEVTVNAIPSDYVIPSGSLTITQNGAHDVSNYASAEVNVAGAGSSSDVEISLLTRTITTYSNPTLTTLGAYAFSGTNVTTLSLPALSSIAGYIRFCCRGNSSPKLSISFTGFSPVVTSHKSLLELK